MSAWTERKIARDLAAQEPVEPPAGLLEKIKSEIPPDLGSRLPAAALQEAKSAEVVPFPKRRRWLLAASLAGMVAAGLLGSLVMREAPEAEEVAAEVDVAVPEQPRVAAAPAPRRDEAAAGQPQVAPVEPPAEVTPVAPATGERKRDLRALGSAGEEPPPAQEKEETFAEGLDAAQESRQEKARPQAAPRPEASAVLQDRRDRDQMAASPPPPPPPPPPPAPEPEGGVESGAVGGVVGGAPGGVNRLSAFGLDVDTASYTVARGYLRDGRLPPREAIRVEEFLSYFSYGDPPPARGDFALRAEGAASIFTQEPRTYLLRFNLRAREVKELTGTLQTIAEDAKVQVEFSPAAVARWRLIGSENRAIPDERFRDNTVNAGEVGAGQSVTALYEVQLTPQASKTGKIASLHLRYRVPVTGELRETVRDLRASELVADWKDASPGFRLASLVVEFAETLRGSSPAEDLRKILRHARRVAGEMAGSPRGADVAEFARLVEAAARIQEAAEKR